MRMERVAAGSLVAAALLSAALVGCGSSSGGASPGGGGDGGLDGTTGDGGGGGDDGGAVPEAGGGDAPNAGDAGHGDAGAAGEGGVSGTVSFWGSWDADPARGRWKDIQVVDAGLLTLDPKTPTWHGMGAARVQVDPGDDPLMLGEMTERAEVLVMDSEAGAPLPETAASGTQYYGLSLLFPSGWAGTELAGNGSSWSIVLQLHGPDALGASPAFALSAAQFTTGGPQLYGVATNGGDLKSGCCGPSYMLSGGSLVTLGKWTDFVIAMTYASTPTGHITIWRRDEGQAKFAQVLDVPNVATLQYSTAMGVPVGDHYWKQGLYRGGVSRVDVHWMGPTVRATTFAAAEMAAFGTSDGT